MQKFYLEHNGEREIRSFGAFRASGLIFARREKLIVSNEEHSIGRRPRALIFSLVPFVLLSFLIKILVENVVSVGGVWLFTIPLPFLGLLAAMVVAIDTTDRGPADGRVNLGLAASGVSVIAASVARQQNLVDPTFLTVLVGTPVCAYLTAFFARLFWLLRES